MSTALPTREKTTHGTSSASSSAAPPLFSQPSGHKRVLACVLCHQRKVKCERKFPCSNCVRSGAQCVPTTVIPRQRRRRFPERVLLERLRKYEDLLRQNNVSFEPLHKDWTGEGDSNNLEANDDSDDEHPSAARGESSSLSPADNFDTIPDTKYFLDSKYPDTSNDDVKNGFTVEAWDELFDNTDHLLLGSRQTSVDLSALQPEPVHIFRLWQIYLDNVNPLLKVTHTPTLQPRIIKAMGNMKNINRPLEALMFSIYCMAILTVSEDECQSLFGSPKSDLVMRFQFDHKSTGISPIWDCRIPLNVNESELRPEMKEVPPIELKSTEALFIVVRSEISDFLRHTAFYLDFSSPALKSVTKGVHRRPVPDGSEVDTLEEMINNKYLQFLDPEIPLHYITIWTARATFAKWRIVEYYWRYSGSSTKPTESQLDAILGHAFRTLECDTKLMSSPLTKGYHWLIEKYFPLPGYMHIVRDIRNRPVSKQAERAWEIMSDSFEARSAAFNSKVNPRFTMFNKIVMEVWELRAAELKRLGKPITLPRIVSKIKSVPQPTQDDQITNPKQPDSFFETNINDLSIPIPTVFDTNIFPYSMDWQDTTEQSRPEVQNQGAGLHLSDADMNQLDWAAMVWGFGEHHR
ncbi:hypothetical protein G7Z17_g2915 [Cylindrodendrum hubeiense]|uniref:Zn(2)-C6 fungal-type domain-containing protein n=1 Tax=Cylindrodendrum hubeiense TaxID=595255 RepID=A0A9P5LJW1_9HYPO|nr:hypothetical protein G7Z17_g2915 [Cylindrodendrum hubeiense]